LISRIGIATWPDAPVSSGSLIKNPFRLIRLEYELKITNQQPVWLCQ